MNHFSFRQLTLTFAVIVALAACNKGAPPEASAPATTAAPAATAETTLPAPSTAATAIPAESAEAASATPIPDTADDIWQAINQKSVELKTSIAGGDLKNVHHQAFAIRDLVAALPAHTPALPTEDATKLQNEIQFVSTLADRLDAAGDSADRTGAQDNYDKLVAVLNGMTRYK